VDRHCRFACQKGKEITIIFLKKILKKLLTELQCRAIILLPGSERLEGEPGQVRREKPVEEKGASLNSETESIQENQAAERDGS